MSYLQINQLSIQFANKLCFDSFSANIHPQDRIVLIGDNGSGKTSLLKALCSSSLESVHHSSDLRIGYLPQHFEEDANETLLSIVKQPIQHILEKIEKLKEGDYEEVLDELIAGDAFSCESRLEALLDQMDLSDKKEQLYSTLSGGEKMRIKMVKLLISGANLLLLDEPTNHLDAEARKWMLDFLNNWKGAALVVTHDLDLLNQWPKKVWAIENGEINVFEGKYPDYLREKEIEKEQAEAKRESLIQRKKALVKLAQEEQQRVARKAKQGQKKYANDPLQRKGHREMAQNTLGKSHKKKRAQEKREIAEEIKKLGVAKKVTPRFHYSHTRKPFCMRIEEGSIGYPGKVVMNNIHFSIQQGQRIAITGPNGSGKSTFFKALMNDPSVERRGSWEIPSIQIGYLEQQFPYEEETILDLFPNWSLDEIQTHLAGFLFYDQRSLNQQITSLSEGEKIRLHLALIAADTPDLLILDEVTNHLDLQTKQHLIEVLNSYQGALIINSHEEAFLDQVKIERHC